MRHVAILSHPHAPLDSGKYWLRAICECWSQSGMEVSLVSDPEIRMDADAAVLHVDLTRVPQNCLAFGQRFPVALNGSVPDISKRAISAHLLDRGDSWHGQVIVKTDLNCYGYPEMSIARRALDLRGQQHARGYLGVMAESRCRQLRRRRDGRAKAALEYRVFTSIADVPDDVWRDRNLVVERFLPERSDGRYCVRTWLFLGDRDRHAIFYSNDPIIKGANIIGHDALGEVPEELRQIRRDLKFDFGKFDYTMVAGRPILFDANRTPTFGEFSRERYMPIARSLAEGIAAFAKNSASTGSRDE